jgi:hypothetical protein|tara:strand:+ start:1386 stop:1925 length:540 start_codon:yes stop_codon:yes gene_type:complete
MADATTFIATQTVSGSSTTTISFGSIPSSYDDLFMIGQGRCDSTADKMLYMDIVLNSDTGNNYVLGYGYAYGSGVGSVVDAAKVAIWRTQSLPGIQSSEDNPGGFVMYMPQYSSSAYKTTMVYMSGGVLNATNGLQSNCHFKGFGLWDATAAVNQIELKTLFGNFEAGSSYSLYGISNS